MGLLRRAAYTAAGLLLVGAAVLLLHRPILAGLGSFLVIDDRPAPADVILLLNGGMDHRPFRAAELFHQGLAPRIAIVQARADELVDLGLRRTQTELSVVVLRSRGVPADVIEVIPFSGGASSTRDEGRALARTLHTRGKWRRVLVVTSDYHTRRARWTLRRELGDLPVALRMVAVPGEVAPAAWWRSEDGLLLYLSEYLKHAHTWFSGRAPALP